MFSALERANVIQRSAQQHLDQIERAKQTKLKVQAIFKKPMLVKVPTESEAA